MPSVVNKIFEGISQRGRAQFTAKSELAFLQNEKKKGYDRRF